MNFFKFYTRITQVKLLGRVSRNVKELSEALANVPSASIYHHTHRYLEQHRYFSPEHPNDFSYWINNSLGLKKLGELVASLDIFQFRDIEDLRRELIKILKDYLVKTPSLRNCIPGEEFNFLSSRIFIIPTNFTAKNLEEFKDCIGKASIHSIYFHMFEARVRLKKGDNDFSYWLRTTGYPGLADRLSRFDPYTYTLEGIRRKIIEAVTQQMQSDAAHK
ncbi:MAG: hypothetical protein JW734_01510 [Candidatus Omnitrophica bacterium]|nr:hypothetical protein [Candidatus Omnitrophota bacterium]